MNKDKGLVVIDFRGASITWLGLQPEKALEIAKGMTECAEKIMGRQYDHKDRG